MRSVMAIVLMMSAGCGNKQAPAAATAATTAPAATAPDVKPTQQTAVVDNKKPAAFVKPQSLRCDAKPNNEPVRGPDCVTAEIKCGETVTGHTIGGVNRYDTQYYVSNFCWTGARNHNGGDERVYMFVADRTDGFKAGKTRLRLTMHFDSPCADLTFSAMRGALNTCPTSTRQCDTANPHTRKQGRSTTHLTADSGEVYYLLVEGVDDAEGAFAITLECES